MYLTVTPATLQVGRIAQSCRYFSHLTDSTWLWHSLVNRDFGGAWEVPAHVASNQDWQRLYGCVTIWGGSYYSACHGTTVMVPIVNVGVAWTSTINICTLYHHYASTIYICTLYHHTIRPRHTTR